MNNDTTSRNNPKHHAPAIIEPLDVSGEKYRKLEAVLRETERELQTLKAEIEKRVEEQVSQKNLELQLFHDLAQKIGYTLSYDELFRSLLEHLHLVVPCDVAGGILIEGQRSDLFLKTYRPMSLPVQMLIQQRLLDGCLEVGELPMDGCSLCLHYLNHSVAELAHAPVNHLGSYVLVPIITHLEPEKQIIGLLFIGAEKEQQFTDNNIHLVCAIATQASVFVQQLRLLLAAEQSRLETEKIRQNLEKERELNDLKSRVIRTISHEYRTPLTIISLASELLENQYDRLSEQQRFNCLKKISSATRQMANLVDDVLLLNQADAGQIELNPVKIDLINFCQQLIDGFQLVANEKQEVQFTYQGAPFPVYLDKKLLWQILANLLSNAIKYSSEGGIIHFTLLFNQQEVVFNIQDQGIGIPSEDQPRLFDFYHRANNVKNLPGTGLGLAIVKKCVDLHGGEIEFESEVGVGTTFRVKLPLKLSKDQLLEKITH